MKNTLLPKKINKPEAAKAIAVTAAFWILQSFAWNLIISSMIGSLPKIVSAVALGVFIPLLIIRLSHSWSRFPAFLGLFSTIWMAAIVSLTMYVGYYFETQFMLFTMLFALALSVIGITIDAERCWHLAVDLRSSDKVAEHKHPFFAAFRHTLDAAHT